MNRVKTDTTLSFSFTEPSPALEALLGQGNGIGSSSQRGSVGASLNDFPCTDDTDDRHDMSVSDSAGSSSRRGDVDSIGETPRRASSESTRAQTSKLNETPSPPGRTDNSFVTSGTPGATNSSGTLPSAFTTPVAAGQAAKLKRSFSVAMGQNPSGTMKVLAEHDPENHEIKRLRERGLKWGEIAEQVNKQRVTAGKVPGLTDNAVYSRYTRNAPRIAAAKGEVWDPKTVGPHPSKKTEPMAPITGFDDKEDQRLVEAYTDIQKETWELVSQRIVAKGGRKHDPALCARRYQSI
ncbi:MAG: hypothetical protein M1830_010715 [Pleopsidium flavum]|nr:MAG: hypothetical protein M1830_010715 [Pleopsidium flavum]